MRVVVGNRQRSFRIDRKSVEPVVSTVLKAEGRECDEVGIHFVGQQEMIKLHLQFFDDPSITDCISLPLQDDHSKITSLLGDVFVCPTVAQQYSDEHGLDPYREVTLYVIHGILHLIGYDDMEIGHRKAMRAAEKRLMKRLEKQNLLIHS